MRALESFPVEVGADEGSLGRLGMESCGDKIQHLTMCRCARRWAREHGKVQP